MVIAGPDEEPATAVEVEYRVENKTDAKIRVFFIGRKYQESMMKAICKKKRRMKFTRRFIFNDLSSCKCYCSSLQTISPTSTFPSDKTDWPNSLHDIPEQSAPGLTVKVIFLSAPVPETVIIEQGSQGVPL